MCFLLSYLLVTTITLTFLSQPSQEKDWFQIPAKFCDQLKLRNLFYLNICSGRDENKTTHLDSKINSEVTQSSKNESLVTPENFEMNSRISQDISATKTRNLERVNSPLSEFYRSLEHFERRIYWTTFSKIAAVGDVERRENGMSFVQSSLFLFMALLAVSMKMDEEARNEIQKTIGYRLDETDAPAILQEVTSRLPTSSASFKFLWAIRLVLKDGMKVENMKQAAKAMKLNIDTVANNDIELTSVLNNMVSNDSAGAMKNTFEEEELVNGICAVLLTTLYVRPRWRASPVVLNGTTEFHDSDNPKKLTRMISINDEMLYANLEDLDAEAVQIQYEPPELALLVLVPRGNSLRRLASRMTSTSPTEIYKRMKQTRVAVTLPLYTLRMTLLLQNKLEQMGITKLFIPNTSNASSCEQLLISHAVQRIMFWSEAGRHAFKDDGIQWDPTPEKEVIVNRPYLFYVRWKNITILNGNFVL
ncbi:antichymotrypsin-2-like [Aricia agestis]|uniref:antichymotrypsin-2-like n=1 Tax=Aricia agestis TaxID=91739 RepID=UPI001C20B0F5|nr:antichymotrypsin-2-like [Aricia agestis]